MRTELGSWRRAWRRVGKVGKAEVEVEEAEARRRARRTASRGGEGKTKTSPSKFIVFALLKSKQGGP